MYLFVLFPCSIFCDPIFLDVRLPGFVSQQVAEGMLPRCVYVYKVNDIMLATDQV